MTSTTSMTSLTAADWPALPAASPPIDLFALRARVAKLEAELEVVVVMLAWNHLIWLENELIIMRNKVAKEAEAKEAKAVEAEAEKAVSA